MQHGLELDTTVYVLDATTIDPCLSLFDWAPFGTANAAVKLHTLLDLRRSIPAFIHISDGKMHEVNVLEMLTFEPGTSSPEHNFTIQEPMAGRIVLQMDQTASKNQEISRQFRERR